MLLNSSTCLRQEPFPIRFSRGSTAIAVKPDAIADLGRALEQLQLLPPRPVIVVVGGASELRHYHIARLRKLFVRVLAPLAQSLNAIVIDGGTDTGVMQMMGWARRTTQSTFPLVGLVPLGLTTLPEQLPPAAEAASLEPNHTHFLLVPGAEWGAESAWIATAASLLSQGLGSVTVLINGGEITWKDAAESVQVDRPIVVIAGSGRAADTLVAALNGNRTEARAEKLVATGLLQAVRLEDSETLTRTMQQCLTSPAS